MRILHISPTYWPAFSIGGPIWSVHAMNKALVQAGVEVVVYTTDFAQPDEIIKSSKHESTRTKEVDGVEVHYFPISWKGWQYSREMHKAIKENIADFDVVHITSVFLAASTLGAHYAKKAGVPYVISPRGALMEGTLAKKKWKKKLYLSLVERRNLCDGAVHFTVPMEREEYKKAGLPSLRDVVIPNAMDVGEQIASHSDDRREEESRNPNDQRDPRPNRTSSGRASSQAPQDDRAQVTNNELPITNNFCKEYEIPEDAPIVLFLGRLSWKKGLDTLIPAFARVLEGTQHPAPSTQPVLVIVGGDAEGYRGEVEKLITNNPPSEDHPEGGKLQMGKDIVFTGELLGEEKEAVFRAADVFALTSYSENFGMAVLEAAAYELPVIITPQVGVAPYIAEADAGLVVEKDEEQAANAIAELLGDKEKSQAMGRRGKRLVEEQFTPEQIAKEWKRAYKNLIHSSKNW